MKFCCTDLPAWEGELASEGHLASSMAEGPNSNSTVLVPAGWLITYFACPAMDLAQHPQVE